MITDADGNSVATCPVYYQTPIYVGLDNMQMLHVYPTIVEAGQSIKIMNSGNVDVYDAVGRLVQVVNGVPGTPAIIAAPQVSGVYILRSGNRTARVIVK